MEREETRQGVRERNAPFHLRLTVAHTYHVSEVTIDEAPTLGETLAFLLYSFVYYEELPIGGWMDVKLISFDFTRHIKKN